MVSRILKARYFKHVDIMEAKLGTNPSYVWRSLIWSRELLKKGLYWRVGNGNQIKALNDKWIPHRSELHLHPSYTGTSNFRVRDLLVNGTWNIQEVRDRFPLYIAQEILNIPLTSRCQDDSRFWFNDPKGVYTVREGYKTEMGFYEAPIHQTANSGLKWWKFIWSLSVPPKVKIFWWRLSHDCIPTDLNLRRHHVPSNGGCWLCGYGMDTTIHSLFFCSKIKHFWKNSEFWYLLKKAKEESTLDLCIWMQQNLSKRGFEFFATITWAIWKEKQRVCHCNGKTDIVKNLDGAGDFLYAFRRAQRANHYTSANDLLMAAESWQKPPEGVWKMNVDACVHYGKEIFGVGGAIRNSRGEILLAFGRSTEKPESVVEAELMALKEGLQIAVERKIEPLMVESGSSLAVQAVTQPLDNLNYVGLLTADIHFLQNSLCGITIKHTRRSANIVAHSIANFASSFLSPFIWENENFPLWLQELVTKDYSS